MARFIEITAERKLVSETAVDLPSGGSVVVEVVQAGEAGFITATTILDEEGKAIRSVYCGTCGGVPVGCVDCPGNNPVLDCVNMRIYCG